MSKISNIIFLVALIAISSVAAFDVEATATAVGVYPNLVQFVVPTQKMNCSTIQSMIDLFTQGYTEITGLSTYSCLKALFDSKVADLKKIISSGNCVNTSSTPAAPAVPTAEVRCGDSNIWAVDRNYYAWTRNSVTGTWQKTNQNQFSMGVNYYIERYPNCDGGYSWAIGPSSGPWLITGLSSTQWVRPGGSWDWNFVAVRISQYDQSVWSITIKYGLQYASSYNAGMTQLSSPASDCKLRYVEPSAKDAGAYAVCKNHKVYRTNGPNQAWTEITGLAVFNLRVILNGYIFAIGTDTNAYYKASDSAAWTVLSGQSGFIFIDVNNRGRIYAVKSDHSVWSREYIGGTWTDTGKAMETIRVLDDGSAVGIGYNDVQSGVGHVWIRNTTSWVQAAENNGFNGAVSLWGPSSHKVYWSENNVYYNEIDDSNN